MRSIDKINKILAKRHMTGAELSRQIGASRGAYSNWNTGKSQISEISLYKIADVLGVDVEELREDGPETAAPFAATAAATDEMEAMVQAIKDNPGMRTLFKKVAGATPEQLFAIGQMVDAFRNGG